MRLIYPKMTKGRLYEIIDDGRGDYDLPLGIYARKDPGFFVDGTVAWYPSLTGSKKTNTMGVDCTLGGDFARAITKREFLRYLEVNTMPWDTPFRIVLPNVNGPNPGRYPELSSGFRYDLEPIQMGPSSYALSGNVTIDDLPWLFFNPF